MSAGPWPDHVNTLDQWDALPPDRSRFYGLVDHTLYATPRALLHHEQAAMKLGTLLAGLLPSGMSVQVDSPAVITGLWPTTVPAVDLLITTTDVGPSEHEIQLPAEDVLLAIEIVSPGSRQLDRGTQLFEYADAGVRNYWILDVEEPVGLTAYHLVDGEYQQVTEGRALLELTTPRSVTLDLP